MAHSLFEPAPPPFHEKIWRRVRDLNFGAPLRDVRIAATASRTDPELLRKAERLDARGRLALLESVLTSRPIGK
ncbi:hypothetical protein [Roseibium sp. MMSF_3412]|uniref:hypothetical protein n=1 Tax=Roseibium sp. MMSF_3412 TaxID=3046712 RepID=UPI00273EFBEB|nr:hypothetical protein [Roseibium sp. MMSF_3412]